MEKGEIEMSLPSSESEVRRKKRKEQGIALLIVLLMVALLSSFIIEFTYSSTTRYTSTAYFRDKTKGLYLARSGLNFYILILSFAVNIGRDENLSNIARSFGINLSQALWQSIPFIDTTYLRYFLQGGFARSDTEDETIEEGSEEEVGRFTLAELSGAASAANLDFISFDGDFRAEIEDEDKKINLNALLTFKTKEIYENPVAQSIQGLMMGEAYDELFRREGVDRMELISNIIDWIDSDGERAGGLGGYEDSLYQIGDDPYNTKNARFDTLDEVRLVSGMTDDIFREFSPYWTVYTDGKININTADSELIKGLILAYSDPIIPETTAQEITESIITMRSTAPFSSPENFITFVKNQGVNIKGNLKNYIKTDSKIFRITSYGIVGETVTRIIAVIEFTGANRYRFQYYRED